MIASTSHKEKIITFLKKGSLGVVVIAVLGFVGLKLYPLVHGPQLELETLSNGDVLTQPMIRISGKALYTKDLIVNGSPLALATDGSFNENLVINPGYNFITIAAKDRFGKLESHNYAVVLNDSGSQTLSVGPQIPPPANQPL